MQEFQLCHISQLEPGHDSVASRLHMIPVKHTAAFTHRRFYIQTLLYRITFTQTDFYTQAPLLKDALHTNTFTKKPFHTLERNWIIRVIRRELNPITCSSTRLYYIYNYNYIWDYAGHQLRLKCAQVHHQSPAGTFSRVPGKWLRRSPTPTGPRWPPALIKCTKMSHQRNFTPVQTFHTHTHPHTHTHKYIYIHM